MKIGYIMGKAYNEHLVQDRKWMSHFGCERIYEEEDDKEHTRPLWKQLMLTLQAGDTLVISKFSNAVRGSRELAIFLGFCQERALRLVSIHDHIDTDDQLFPETRPQDLLSIIGALPSEAFAMRKQVAHKIRMKTTPPGRPSRSRLPKTKRLEREQTVVNMYVSGHSIDDIWTASGFKSRSSIFRILNKHHVSLNRGPHSGPLKKREEQV